MARIVHITRRVGEAEFLPNLVAPSATAKWPPRQCGTWRAWPARPGREETCMTQSRNPTACLLVIGNEVLSGRTQDANIKFLATRLGAVGIPLREGRVIPDVAETIVATVNEVRARFDHVFTTGGIGPTHDDITSECVAAAFGVPWERHPEAWARMARYYAETRGGIAEFNPARQRMATMPRGAALIDN